MGVTRHICISGTTSPRAYQENDNVFVGGTTAGCATSRYKAVGTAIAWACLASYSVERGGGVLLSAMGLLAGSWSGQAARRGAAIREGAWEIVRHWDEVADRGPRRPSASTRRSIGSRTRSRSGATSTRGNAIARRDARGAHVSHEGRVDADRGPGRLRGGPENHARDVTRAMLPREGIFSRSSTLAYGRTEPRASLLDRSRRKQRSRERRLAARLREHPVS